MNTSTAILLAGALGGVAGGAMVWVAMESAPRTTLVVASPLAAVSAAPEPVSRIEPEPALRRGVPARTLLFTKPEPVAATASPSPVALRLAAVNEVTEPSPGPVRHTTINALSVRNSQAVFAPTALVSTRSATSVSIDTAAGGGTIDDALSYALEASDPCVKEGFTLREDYWGGYLAVRQSKAIVHQLFKGNEYWFWMGTGDPFARISVHVYDSDGTLAEAEYRTADAHKAAVRVIPWKTGAYHLVVEVERGTQQRSAWALAYGFR